MKFSIRDFFPNFIYSRLWGNRKRWGLTPKAEDPCWQEWGRTYVDFYQSNQRHGVGTIVNDAGYRIMSGVDLSGKTVLEVGAGDIRHLDYLNGNPSEYILADISNEMMEFAKSKLKDRGISYKTILVDRNQVLPIEKASVDVVISFYSLEHIYPLDPFIKDIDRVLKPNGILVGAIPAEGGLAWGIGRFLTSRRWLKKKTKIDPDKIICWEHPNFADRIIKVINKNFLSIKIKYWPFRLLPFFDNNLIISFIYKKKSD